MELNLEKPLVFFDLEATGLNVITDRIVQIGMIKYGIGGKAPEEYVQLINPGIPIGEEAMSVHGITPQMLSNKPTFAQVAQAIFEFIGNADMAGFNSNRYDLPLLMEEFARVGIEFTVDKRRLVDAQRIFYKMEPRTLKAALKFYCGEDMENAHDAMADVRATVNVVKGQIERYQGVDFKTGDDEIIVAPIRNDVQALHDFSSLDNAVDATQRLKRNPNGVVVFNFGKNIGKPVGQTLYNDRQYYHWMLNKDFSSQVKQLIKKLLKEYEAEINAKNA